MVAEHWFWPVLHQTTRSTAYLLSDHYHTVNVQRWSYSDAARHDGGRAGSLSGTTKLVVRLRQGIASCTAWNHTQSTSTSNIRTAGSSGIIAAIHGYAISFTATTTQRSLITSTRQLSNNTCVFTVGELDSNLLIYSCWGLPSAHPLALILPHLFNL